MHKEKLGASIMKYDLFSRNVLEYHFQLSHVNDWLFVIAYVTNDKHDELTQNFTLLRACIACFVTQKYPCLLYYSHNNLFAAHNSRLKSRHSRQLFFLVISQGYFTWSKIKNFLAQKWYIYVTWPRAYQVRQLNDAKQTMESTHAIV